MKKIVAFFVIAMALVGCDIIPEGDRLKPYQPLETQKRVLLTEFTGMKCVNCPRAAELAHQIKEQYPDNFVVVAMHPKSNHFTTPDDADFDLRCEEADEYYKYFGGAATTSFPKGVVNWKKFNNLYLQNDGNWEALVNAELNAEQEMEAAIDMSVISQKSENLAEITITINALTEVNNASLVLMVTEDGIIAPQAFPEGEDHEYEHNHVLRTVLNGTWGETIEPIMAGDEWTKEITCGFDEEWDMQNCNIVAVLIDKDTHEVINCLEVPVVGTELSCVEFTLYDKENNMLQEGDTLRITKVYEEGMPVSMQIDGRVECAEPIFVTVSLKEPAEFSRQTFCTGMTCMPPAETYQLRQGSWYGHYDTDQPGEYIIDYIFHDAKGDHTTTLTLVYECVTQ